MRLGAVSAVALVAAMLVLPPLAAAQAHEHGEGGGPLHLLHDAPDDGTAYVGGLSHFGWLLLRDDGGPSRHQNAEFTVTQNGVTLFATTPDSGHDYDANGALDVVFPVPGPYEVTAKVGDHESMFRGEAVVPEAPVEARLEVEAPTSTTADMPAAFRIAVVDAATGAIIPHSDVLATVRRADPRDDGIAFRTHVHAHGSAVDFQYAFPEPGAYTMTLTAYQAYPDKSAATFLPVRTVLDVQVGSGSQWPAPPAAGVDRPNGATVVDADPEFTLLGTYDPDPVVGPFGVTYLNVVVFDAKANRPVPHVDFKARVLDATGDVVFESASLHEYDGVLTIGTEHREPGRYTATIEAKSGDKSAAIEMGFSVVPPVEAFGAGPQFVRVSGLEELRSGTTAGLEIFQYSAGGAPNQHSEIDLVLAKKGEAEGDVKALLVTKLHTHSTGKFPFRVTFPEPGTYVLRTDMQAAHKTPTYQTYGEDLTSGRILEFEVAEGIPLPVPDLAPIVPTGAIEPAETPGAFAAVGIAGLAIAALAARTRK